MEHKSFLIDEDSKVFLKTINFVPNRKDRIFVNNTESVWKYDEYEVTCVTYDETWNSECSENTAIVFVRKVDPKYLKIINDIKWK